MNEIQMIYQMVFTVYAIKYTFIQWRTGRPQTSPYFSNFQEVAFKDKKREQERREKERAEKRGGNTSSSSVSAFDLGDEPDINNIMIGAAVF